jgi:hypothetical protein
MPFRLVLVLETYLANAPSGLESFRMALPVWLKEKLFQKPNLAKALKSFSRSGKVDESRLLFAEHHQSHAAAAFFPSPFKDAVVLTMDGVGEWATTSVSIGHDNQLETIKEIRWPHSLGLLYSAFTYYTGFKVNSGEYKVMGLAPYGERKYVGLILDNILDLKPDGSFWLDQSYFNARHRSDDDLGEVPQIVRSATSNGGEYAHSARDGSRSLGPEGDRGGHAAYDARPGPQLRDTKSLLGRGRRAQLCRDIGYIDVHLLAAVRLTAGVTLWTKDKGLHAVANELGLAMKRDRDL